VANEEFQCIPSLNSADLFDWLEMVLSAGQVPMVYGAAGVGKSSIYRQLADKHGRALLDVRLTYKLPEHIGSMQFVAKDGLSAVGLKPLLIAQVEKLQAETGKPVLVLFDELTLAGQETLSAALEFLLDKRVDGHAIPAGTWVAAAGNRPSDTSSAMTLDPPIRSRVKSAVYSPSAKDTAKYLRRELPQSQLRDLACAFLESTQSNQVMGAEPGNNAAFYTPRGFESAIIMAASRAKDAATIGKDKMIRLAFESSVGKAVWSAFASFVTVTASLKNPADILDSADIAEVPGTTEAALAQFSAIMTHVRTLADKKRVQAVSAFLDYLERCGAQNADSVRIWGGALSPDDMSTMTQTIRGKRLFADVGYAHQYANPNVANAARVR